MSFITNIRSVAKYESKLLVRSWFFRIFIILALLVLGFFNAGVLLMNDGGAWVFKSISSNIPYINLLLLNTGQAVIAIFLSSDFLKRDKKLDTSEVFYVHSLSNAEYVFGKIWGNLKVFLLLNLIVMAMALIFNLIASGVSVDWASYVMYFLIISVPTLIFIIGLSIFLMLVLKNQALTFIILLGYIGLTLFYIGNKFYYLFDYMAYSLPLVKSTMVGLTNYGAVIVHRSIYLLAGFAFIFFTISLFNRLPNSRRGNYLWISLGICMLLLSVSAGYEHVNSIRWQTKVRALYTDINNKYVHTPRMVIDTYSIFMEQHPGSISAEVTMKATSLRASDKFTFCLNPGLKVAGVTAGGNALTYSRDHQILLVDFGREIAQGDTVSLTVKYDGKVENEFCYLDIPAEKLEEENRDFLLNIDKKYLFQTDGYLLFTPECYWYPRPGVSYSDESPDWQQSYFSHFDIRVKPLPGLTPVSQGEMLSGEDGSFAFAPDKPLQAATIAIGNYRHKEVKSDSVLFSVWYIDGHDNFSLPFDSIADTIPTLLENVKRDMERAVHLTYPFSRFSVVEVPAQFHSYPRVWSQAQETVQPELVLFQEKGWRTYEMDIERRWKDHIKWAQWSNRTIDEKEAKMNAFRDIIHLFTRSEGYYRFSSTSRGGGQINAQVNAYYVFPQFYNFRYNIFSPQWPVANKTIELYLQNKQDNRGWERDFNGISNSEKANMLLEEHSFRELLADVKYSDIQDNVVSLKSNQLFAQPEINIGVKPFRDTLYAVLNRNTFHNIQFENLLDTLGGISHANIIPELERWDEPVRLPYYTVRYPEVTRFDNKGKEEFVLKLVVTNDSDYDGIIHLTVNVGNYWDEPTDPRANRKVAIKARSSRLLVTVWEEAPRFLSVNTLISNNLPSRIEYNINNIRQGNGRRTETEGDYETSASLYEDPDEIIVDNEDPLFFLSQPAVVGLLPGWLDKVEDTSFKYAGVSPWRAPLQWTATTNSGYYGKYVRSAYVIRSGDGGQTATWKIPVPSPGYYELYYWAFSNEVKNNRRHSQGEYHFRINYGTEEEDAYLNLRDVGEEWERLGVYYLDTDTMSVALSNNCKLRTVTADAVRLVKRK